MIEKWNSLAVTGVAVSDYVVVNPEINHVGGASSNAGKIAAIIGGVVVLIAVVLLVVFLTRRRK